MKKFLLTLLLSAYSAATFAQVNINTATVEELSALSGIGQSKAEAIIEYREANGQFQNADALTNVKGIGEKTVDKIRNNLTVEGKTDLTKLK
ncbi:ComEA family DNA-binding protein [Ostreibacterium oceani]|uniref:Competence protein ComEA n=1 Tax=Ostreibacterium oceani TaxID=2654998 RepID=A0A6N7EY80_9GAMM|nr:competence protein ComEA [Ostreibacterium oceani]